MSGILVFGNGWIGNKFIERYPEARMSIAIIEKPSDLAEILDREKPDAVLNCAGLTGTPNVDWCETHQLETAMANTWLPILMSNECAKLNIHFTHLSSGCIFYGTQGKLMCGTYGKSPILLPSTRMENFVEPQKTIRRISNAMDGGHEQDWIRACKENKSARLEASSNFSYSGPLNEMVVMGVLAVRLQNLQRKLLWDGVNMRFTNISPSDKIKVLAKNEFEVLDGHPKFRKEYETLPAFDMAEEWIRHNYRQGWEQV